MRQAFASCLFWFRYSQKWCTTPTWACWRSLAKARSQQQRQQMTTSHNRQLVGHDVIQADRRLTPWLSLVSTASGNMCTSWHLPGSLWPSVPTATSVSPLQSHRCGGVTPPLTGALLGEPSTHQLPVTESKQGAHLFQVAHAGD